MALPEVRERPAYGMPSFRVRGTIIARLLDDLTSLLVHIDPSERAVLVDADPQTYAVRDAGDSPSQVAVRLDGVDAATVQLLLTSAWRAAAPRRLVAEFDAGHPGAGG